MWVKLLLVALLVSSIQGKSLPARKKVCVIGAGVTGLTSVKHVAEHIDELEPVVFEKNSDVGGLWIYTESSIDEHGLPVHSSVYKNLRTNVPKELMAWPDYRDFTGDERSSVPHQKVWEYLRNYTAHYELRQYIRLNTLVEYVSPLADGGDDILSTKWLVKTKNLNTNAKEETVCDAVMVCNGHFTKPNTPKIPGIENFQGPIMHSHTYRNPEDFAGKTVAILGAGVSGVDISVDVSSSASKVYLSHRHNKIQSEFPWNIEQVPGIVKANGNELILSNGSSITADAFVYCTGYLFDVPFLDESSGITIERTHVRPLYNQMINVQYPTMAFIGLPSATSIFLIPYVQSQYFVALLQGKVQLPSREEMINNSNTLPPGAAPNKYHAVNAYQWTYNEALAKAGGFELPPSYYKDGLNLWNSYRDTHLATFRSTRFHFNADGTFQLVHA